MPPTTTTTSDATTVMPEPPLSQLEAARCRTPSPGSPTSNSHCTPELQPTPETRARIRKLPMREFKWEGDLIRNTLPTLTLPSWLDPMWVDVDDPTRLPLCWYGVPFVSKLFYECAERVGLASYYTRKILRSNPGDLDPYRTWGNMQEWIKKKTGLKIDLNLAWGEDEKPEIILTFWSNHGIDNVTQEMLDGTYEMLDYLEYGEEYDLMWYLDHNLRY